MIYNITPKKHHIVPGAGVHLKIILEQTEETDEPAYQKQSHLDE